MGDYLRIDGNKKYSVPRRGEFYYGDTAYCVPVYFARFINKTEQDVTSEYLQHMELYGSFRDNRGKFFYSKSRD